MYADKLKHGNITEIVIKCFYEVYNELGHGFLESVYEKALAIVLAENGLVVETQKEIPVFFRGHIIAKFVADIIVEEKVILEIKAAKSLDSAHEAQLLNYLKATPIDVGLLLNFGKKAQFKRMIFESNR